MKIGYCNRKKKLEEETKLMCLKAKEYENAEIRNDALDSLDEYLKIISQVSAEKAKMGALRGFVERRKKEKEELMD